MAGRMTWSLLALIGAGSALALLVGLLSAFAPPIAVIAVVGPIGLAFLVNSAILRFVIVTFGGLVVLQSSAGIDLRKVLYLAACAIVFTIAALRSQSLQSPTAKRLVRPFFIMSLAWVAVVAVSFPVSVMHQAEPMDWARDAIPYVLLAAVPVLAADVLVAQQWSAPNRMIVALFVAYGVLTTLAFFSGWVTRRGYVDLGLDRTVFATFIFPCALFSYAIARAFSGRGRTLPWAAVAALVFFLFVLTGARTSLVMLASPIVVSLGQRGGLGRALPRLMTFGLAATAVGLMSFLALPYVIDLDTSQIAARFLNISQVTGESVAGQSFADRSVQTNLTLEAFAGSPLLGTGPGHLYEWIPPYSNVPVQAFVVDSPLSIMAKFGLLGTAVFIFTLMALFLLQARLGRLGGAFSVERDTVRGFLTITLAFSVLASPIDDKGFSFAIAFLLVICLQRVVWAERAIHRHVGTGFHPHPVVQSGAVARRQPAVG